MVILSAYALCNCSSGEPRSNPDVVLVLFVTRWWCRAPAASLKTSTASARCFPPRSSARWLIPRHVRSLNHSPRARSTSVTSRTRHADRRGKREGERETEKKNVAFCYPCLAEFQRIPRVPRGETRIESTKTCCRSLRDRTHINLSIVMQLWWYIEN